MRNAQRGFNLIELVLFIVIVGAALGGIMAMYVRTTTGSADPYIRQRAIAVAGAYMDEILRKRWNENTPTGGGCVVTASGVCAAGAVPWTSTTLYAANAWVVPTPPNGCFFQSLGGGTSGGGAPAWPAALGSSVVDGTLTWTCMALSAAPIGPEGEARAAFDDIDDYQIAGEAPTDQTGAPMAGNFGGFNVTVAVQQPAANFNGINANDVREIVVTVSSPLNENIVLRAYRMNF